MNEALLRGGQLVGLVGILMMLGAVAGRLTGHFTLGNFQTGTLMLAGIGAVSVGCFLLLWRVASDRRRL